MIVKKHMLLGLSICAAAMMTACSGETAPAGADTAAQTTEAQTTTQTAAET